MLDTYKDQYTKKVQDRHLKKAQKGNSSGNLVTICDKYELNALLEGGWTLVNAFSRLGGPRYSLQLQLDKAEGN